MQLIMQLKFAEPLENEIFFFKKKTRDHAYKKEHFSRRRKHIAVVRYDFLVQSYIYAL